MGAGMRVSGRKSVRRSRRESRPNLESSKQADQISVRTLTPIKPSDEQQPPTNASAAALAITEGRTQLLPGPGLNPEDSDEDSNTRTQESSKLLLPTLDPTTLLDDQYTSASTSKPSHSRSTTGETIKGHRRRISAVTFANQSLTLSSSSPLGVYSPSRSRTRRSRVQSVSSEATTNTIMSSDISETAFQTVDSPSRGHSRRNSNLSINTTDQKEENTDNIESPQPDPIRRRPRLDSKNNTGVYYSAEHDPDKRLSDMLFNFKPFDIHRRTQIVGSVGEEPAPLVEQNDEDDTADEEIDDEDAATDQTDTGPEIGDEDSSSNLGEIGEEDEEEEEEEEEEGDEEEEEEEENELESLQSIQSRNNRPQASPSLTGSTDPTTADDDGSMIGKSFTNTMVSSVMDPGLINKMGDNAREPVAKTSQSAEASSSPNTNTELLNPVIRRRERRRVNIKMGNLLGPPIIEEDNTATQNNSVTQEKFSKDLTEKRTTATRLSRQLHRTRFADTKPSLPDLRFAAANQSATNQTESSKRNSSSSNGISPGRSRSFTSPTPIPAISIELDHCPAAGQNVSTSEKTSLRIDQTASPSIQSPAILRRRRNNSSVSRRVDLEGFSTSTPPSADLKGFKSSAHPVSPAPRRKSKRSPLVFKKIDLSTQTGKRVIKPKSILTELLTAKSPTSSVDNPFRCFYALLASKERNALKITIYYPFSKEPRKPIKTSMRPDICVEEVVGFGLWSYMEQEREPKLADIKGKSKNIDLTETQSWCLRLVEDDGEVDEDFPALERTRAAAKVGSQEFAIVIATEEQAKQNAVAQSQIQRRPSRVLGEPKRPSASLASESATASTATSLLKPINPMDGLSGIVAESSRTIGGKLSGSLLSGGYDSMTLGVGGIGGGSNFMGVPVFLKVRIPSPGGGIDSIMTTLNVTIDMYMAEVLEMLCKKKSLGDSKDWALLVPSSPSIPVHQRDIIVPLDRTVQSLQGVTSLALVKRSQVTSKLLRNSQINRNFTSQNTNPSASIFKRLSEPPQPKYVSITDLTSTNRTFVVQTKRRGILGKQERLLTIEDDYVHLCPNNLSHIGSNNNNNNNSNSNSNNINGNGSGLMNGNVNGHSNGSSGVGGIGIGGSGGAVVGSVGGVGGGGKTSSYHISQIVNCVLRNQNGVKLIVMRESGEKRYDVEAENNQSAIEIVQHIKGLKEMYHTRN
ncbi:stress-activated map kinase interacting protein 1-domain-containing protein [Phakopsora pachyrhizi]|nr:stress-activated map kinase interacting protein 1-domain-containing protein [Phakopsora pachyrhizi]